MFERKNEEFEDDMKQWKIIFDWKDTNRFERGERTVLVSFTLDRKEYPLTEKEIETLKQDLKDLGKFRIIKQGKEFLENESRT
jgi:hypothetical protein